MAEVFGDFGCNLDGEVYCLYATRASDPKQESQATRNLMVALGWKYGQESDTETIPRWCHSHGLSAGRSAECYSPLQSSLAKMVGVGEGRR